MILKTRATREEDKLERRNAILDAAEGLLQTRPDSLASMDEPVIDPHSDDCFMSEALRQAACFAGRGDLCWPRCETTVHQRRGKD